MVLRTDGVLQDHGPEEGDLWGLRMTDGVDHTTQSIVSAIAQWNLCNLLLFIVPWRRRGYMV